MSQTLNSKIAVIGIDIGKNSFHVVGQDRRGALVLRQKWSCGQVEARLANLPPCLIGMEACTGAHHLSRKLQARSRTKKRDGLGPLISNLLESLSDKKRARHPDVEGRASACLRRSG